NFDDTRMGVSQSVHGDTAQEIQIFLAARVKDISAASVGEHERLTLVGGQKKLFGVAQPCIGFRGMRGAQFNAAHGTGDNCVLSDSSHYATERAACAAERR